MKTIRIALLFFALGTLLINCGDDGPTKTKAEVRAAILASGTGKWTPSSGSPVTVNNLAVPELFEDFTITFTSTGKGGTYTTTGTTPVWPRSGTWEFVDDEGLKFKRDDDLEISISDITDKSLKLSLEWDATTFEEPTGRSKSLAGTTVFTLSK